MNSARIGYLYDTNSQTITALQILKILMSNPGGSGKKVICEAYSIPNMTSTVTFGKFYVNPTGGFTPATIATPLPFLIDANWQTPGNVGTFKYDTGLLTSGWTANDIVSTPIKAMDRNYVEGAPLTIMPGNSLGFQFGGLAMAGVTFVMYTREETI